ncbi:MAG: nuclear transport factor 2 family protein [Bacteroidetes bacterium]|nr:nuclear transport factor 2 family protein [Bacteroidota bacterium]
MNRIFRFIICFLFVAIQLFAQEENSFEKQTANTKIVGEEYFSSYILMDWDNLEQLLADSSSFGDPTGQPIFNSVMKYGKIAVMKTFREAYATIEEMKFTKIRSFYSGNHAIFEGNLDWTTNLRNGKTVRSVMPIITILKVENGLVSEHRDYADYAPFLSEYRKVNSSN